MERASKILVKTVKKKPAAKRPRAKATARRELATLDWDKLGFAFTETDVMYRSAGDLDHDPVWDKGAFLPLKPVELSPAAAFLSYGLGVFEGLKAQRAEDGRILLFRHRDNGLRLQRSAERLMMPPFPVDQFAGAIEELVRRNGRFVPPQGKGTFYLRPMQHAIEPKLGLGPCRRFWLLIYGSPVGSYFKGDAKAVKGLRLQVLEQGRVAPGGTGFAKAMGNYAGVIAIAAQWKEKGFDDVLFLDARHLKYLTETSGSNVFVRLKDGRVVTPPLDDQILAGITRDSAVQVARKVLGLAVEERPIAIEEVLDQGEEVFCTGTAWTVRSIAELVVRGRTHSFATSELQRALLDEILAYQSGAKLDPFGWVQEIRE